MVKIGRTWAYLKVTILVKLFYTLPMKILLGLPYWDIYILPTRKEAFIKQSMGVNHGCKAWRLTKIPVPWKWILIYKTPMNYMPAPGIEPEVHGTLLLLGKQVAFTKQRMGEITGNY